MEQDRQLPIKTGLPGKPEIRVNLSDLPQVVVLELPTGETKRFVLDFARRTKGLYLNKIED